MKTHQQLADEYGIHRTTLRRRLKRAGLNLPRGLISPKHQKEVYTLFGPPPNQSSKQSY